VAPIYLVSACTTGEEFVAAFRRYADKHGLFVPIAQPLASGRRGRFAVTLRDGGVMIEGEAEVVSSARTPSVLHGRVGMTLRFTEPDATSKTILGELEKARLAMRPPPPSVAPRPATIPTAPRPVPPPPQGRVDAVNALAECVAIGEPALLEALALPPSAAAPAKAGARFVVPTIAPTARSSAITAPPAAPRAPAAAITERGPASDTMVVAKLPEPPSGPPASSFSEPATTVDVVRPRTGTRQGVAPMPAPPQPPVITETPGTDSATMNVPIPRASSPTDIGGLLVDAADAAAEPTTPPSEPLGEEAADDTGEHDEQPDAIIVAPAPAREDGSARTQVHAGIPPRDPSAPPRTPSEPAARPGGGMPQASDTPAFTRPPSYPTMKGSAIDLTQTVRSAPPEMSEIRATIDSRMAAARGATFGASWPTAQTPVPPIVAATQPAIAEVEISEPTDLSMGPPQPPSDASATDVPTEPEIPRPPRKTAIGVAVVADDAAIPPPGSSLPSSVIAMLSGAPSRGSSSHLVSTLPFVRVAADEIGAATLDDHALAGEEPTGADVVIVEHDSDGRPGARVPAMPLEAAPGEEPTPSEYWTIAPGGALAPAPKRARTPSGGTHQLAQTGPSQPDPRRPIAATTRGPALPAASKSGPVKSGARRTTPAAGATAPSMQPGDPGGRPAAGLPSGDWLIALDPRAPDGWSEPFETVPPQALASEAASAKPAGPRGHRPLTRPDAMPAVEPKVQIDPTLIEPLAGAPPDELYGARSSSPELPMYDAAARYSSPALPGAIPTTPPPPYGGGYPPASQFGAPHGPPAYPLDPAYQMVPIATRAATDAGVSFGNPHYAGPAARSRRRRVIIVVASAIVAAVIGVVVLAVLTGRHDAAPGPADKHVEPPPAPPTHAASPGAALPATPAPVAPLPSAVPQPVATPAPAALEPPSSPCFAEVSSQPSGAEIVVGDARVVGTTPQKVELPCGQRVELTIRKARLAAVTRAILPTLEGAKLRVALARPIVQLKVSSTPAGATITLDGKALGVTPTTVRVPAFESSTLALTKDGYAPAREKVAPRASGGTVHAALKKLERRAR